MTEQKDKNSSTAKDIDNKENAVKVIRKFNGVVVSDKMDKTIIVSIDRISTHAKYKKSFVISKRYKIHDEKNQFKEGDKVTFVQCRPLSKDKRWRVIYS